jgi:hypothetical protein
MKNILFYNLWHNGDVFSGRGYIKRIIDAIPNAKFGYYHKNHSKIVSDLTKITFEPDLNKLQVDLLNFRKIFETDKTIYINTWVGTYFLQHQQRMVDFPSVTINLPGEEHANYRSLHKMYQFIINYLNSYHSCKIELPDDPLECVPEISWDKYQIEPVKKLLSHNKKMHLFCNGKVRSSQSSIGNMQNVVSTLASSHSNELFICCEKFDTSLQNILFTDDIFHLENDLNEISFLSTHCATIVGKNSGPFMFTHVKDNINNPNTTFVAFSNRVSDCYTHHMKNLPCRYLFSNAFHDPAVIKTILAAFSIQKRSIITL